MVDNGCEVCIIEHMTAITAPIIADAESWLKDAMPDMFVDGISSVWRTKLHDDFSATYAHLEDEDEAPVMVTKTLADHVKALELLIQQVTDKKLHVGGIKNPVDLTDMCNWDVEVTDAYFQLVVIGEVIYG